MLAMVFCAKKGRRYCQIGSLSLSCTYVPTASEAPYQASHLIAPTATFCAVCFAALCIIAACRCDLLDLAAGLLMPSATTASLVLVLLLLLRRWELVVVLVLATVLVVATGCMSVKV